jgi:hypothetical protein
MWGVLLGLGSTYAHHPVTYMLHRSTFLTSQPSFKMWYSLELDHLDVTVKEPAREQNGQFCLYK